MMTLAASFLASCTGTLGTIRTRTWKGEGTEITEIRSYGIQIRNIPGYHGISVGSHRTIYANRAQDAQTSTPDDSPWTYGYCPAPHEMPIYLQEFIHGAEAAKGPTFVGLAMGISARTTASLPLNQDESLHIHSHETTPPSITYYTHRARHEP